MVKSIKRSSAIVPTVVLGLVALARVALKPSNGDSPTFLAPASGRSASRGRTVMHGFKEDFDAWRASLTQEERDTLRTQTRGEYNKAYRKTEDFKKDILSDDKVKAFSNILSKFYENEADDYAKTAERRKPDYDGLLKKAGDKQMDMALKNRIVEVDREAERRYFFASQKAKKARRDGTTPFPQSHPRLENWDIPNSNEEEHEMALTVHKFILDAAKWEESPIKAQAAELQKEGVPPMGEEFKIFLPYALTNQLNEMNAHLSGLLKAVRDREGSTDEDVARFIPCLSIAAKLVIKNLTKTYYQARDEIAQDSAELKAFFRSQHDFVGTKKTKADVMKDIYAVLPKHMPDDQELPPLDPEVLAELATYPAIDEGGVHIWGTEDHLYKSEAVDAFGLKYLLGVYKNFEDARDAFTEWNKEYDDARTDMAIELEQWSKSEQAQLDADAGPGTERIKKMLEEARR